MKVLTCSQWDDATQTCVTQAWVEQPTILPPLSVAEAEQLAVPILKLWALAFVLRLVYRFIWRG